MNYITAEQFLELPEEVRDKFLKWAEENFQEWDLIYDTEIQEIRHIEQVLDTRKDSINVGRVFYFGMDLFWTPMYCPEIIPLFRLDQLIEFIQTKYKHIGVNNFISYEKITETTRITSDKGIYEWNIKIFKSMMQFEPDIEVLNEDLLQAFWEVAVMVAEEIGGMNDD
jgi:hypothetical protein